MTPKNNNLSTGLSISKQKQSKQQNLTPIVFQNKEQSNVYHIMT
ncbi:MAG: hypothetical protein ACMG6E_05635 [Candidatus Roizmanbacteria bacterium]